VRLAAFLPLLPLVSACAAPSTGGAQGSGNIERLPAATGEYRHVDNTLVFTLPDSGGFLANTRPLDSVEVEAQLRTVFAPWPSGRRAVFVWDNPRRRDAGQWIRQAAERAGGAAFDAELSGWPRQLPGPPP
jgi:hypothetical protein